MNIAERVSMTTKDSPPEIRILAGVLRQLVQDVLLLRDAGLWNDSPVSQWPDRHKDRTARAAEHPILPDLMQPEDRVRLIAFVYSPAMDSLCHLLLRTSAEALRRRLGVPEKPPYDLDSIPPTKLTADDIRAMNPQATEADAQAYVYFANAARQLRLSPAEFLALINTERRRLKSFEEAFREFGWSPLESPVSFLRRIKAQD